MFRKRRKNRKRVVSHNISKTMRVTWVVNFGIFRRHGGQVSKKPAQNHMDIAIL
jgi:hypothetical protein